MLNHFKVVTYTSFIPVLISFFHYLKINFLLFKNYKRLHITFSILHYLYQ